MRAVLRLLRLVIFMGVTLAILGCAGRPGHRWWPDISYDVLSAFSTDAPDNDPLAKRESIEARRAGLDSTERFHRGL